MRSFTLIELPYHLGLEQVAVGAGPPRLLEAGADRILGRDGAPAEVVHIRKRALDARDWDAIVDINRQLRITVRQAIASDSVPVVLAGNCNSAVGTLAGLDPDRLGIVWFDAHGDFNTPDTSPSGLVEGMSLAIAAGHCHDDLRLRIGLDPPVDEERIALVGPRDLDPGERERLDASQVMLCTWKEIDNLDSLLADLARRVSMVYLHIDIDVLDPAESPGVNCRTPGGLPVRQAEHWIGEVAARLPIGAIGLTNYRPDFDPGGRTAQAALRLLARFCQ
jgi:arginase